MQIVWSIFTSMIADLTRWSGSKTIKSSILVLLALIALSPVLRTLSAATSSDSIWALSAGLFVLNALLADYRPRRAGDYVQGRLDRAFIIWTCKLTLSTWWQTDLGAVNECCNIIIGGLGFKVGKWPGSLCPHNVCCTGIHYVPNTTPKTSGKPTFSNVAQLHCLISLPKASHPPVTALLTIILSASCLHLTMPLSITVTCLYAITFVFVTFLAPAVLVWAQKYKK